MKKISKVSFGSGILFFVLGLVVFLNPDVIVKFISYALGGFLLLIGIYRSVNYYIQNRRFKIVNYNELSFGITAIVLGIVFIFLAGAIELLLRFIVGGWLVISGISKIMKTFYTTSRDSKFYALIVVGVILIGIGFYIIFVSNLALSIIGLFMMIYGLIDFISYFVYKEKEDIKENLIVDEIINDKKNEIVIETEFVEKKDKKKKS